MAKTPKPKAQAELAESGYIRAKALAQFCSVSRTTLWRWARTGRLPKPVKLSENVTAWRTSELKECGLM
ncbi:MAG TPA: AlpA family phage regulatory protein [Candidatus Competibacter sp.]|nr:AlpA family phage regulatory protein [Candidatus Competibacter sp.]